MGKWWSRCQVHSYLFPHRCIISARIIGSPADVWRGCTPWGVCEGALAACPMVEGGHVDFEDELVFGALAAAVTDGKALQDRHDNESQPRFIKTLDPASAIKTGNEPQSSVVGRELMHHVHQVPAHTIANTICAFISATRKLTRYCLPSSRIGSSRVSFKTNSPVYHLLTASTTPTHSNAISQASGRRLVDMLLVATFLSSLIMDSKPPSVLHQLLSAAVQPRLTVGLQSMPRLCPWGLATSIPFTLSTLGPLSRDVSASIVSSQADL